jgi:hypothetical protein
MTTTITAELYMAGTDEDDVTRIAFKTTREELSGWPLPFYRKVRLTIDEIEEEKEETP